MLKKAMTVYGDGYLYIECPAERFGYAYDLYRSFRGTWPLWLDVKGECPEDILAERRRYAGGFYHLLGGGDLLGREPRV